MSRVKQGQKWVNMPRHDEHVYQASKMKRVHFDGEDFHKAGSLSQWLFMKYDMSYMQYKKKSKARKDVLRAEYLADTAEKRAEREANKILMFPPDAGEDDDNIS